MGGMGDMHEAFIVGVGCVGPRGGHKYNYLLTPGRERSVFPRYHSFRKGDRRRYFIFTCLASSLAPFLYFLPAGSSPTLCGNNRPSSDILVSTVNLIPRHRPPRPTQSRAEARIPSRWERPTKRSASSRSTARPRPTRRGCTSSGSHAGGARTRWRRGGSTARRGRRESGGL